MKSPGSRKCLLCNGSYNSNLELCPRDGTQLLKLGEISIEPLDAQYEIEQIWHSRICYTLQLKAKDSQQKVIAKVYIPKDGADMREKERFMRIKSSLEKLNHPSIPHVIQAGKLKDRRPYVLLEYKGGVALSELLAGGKKLAPLNVCRISIKVCEVLEYAHRKGVFHSDLSPGDIIVEPLRSVKDDFLWNVSLVDFGKGNPLIHADNRQAQFTELGDFFGRPEFIAPEILEMKEIDACANVYSLGCVMYRALKGKYAFRGPTWFATLSMHQSSTPSPIFEGASLPKFEDRMQKIVLKCLSKAPDARYATITDLKTELQSLEKSASKNGR